jgi:hypothetical protein
MPRLHRLHEALGAPIGGFAGMMARWPSLVAAALFHYACYLAMIALALWNELRPAATVPDLVIEHVPYLAAVARQNYLIWLAATLPLSLLLLWSEPRRWARYMVTGGLTTLIRGATIVLTGLGPPHPALAGPGIAGRSFGEAFWELVSPLGVFARNSYGAYLTKDLFFSGHTATTFLLVLYLRHRPGLFWTALVAHAVVVSSVLVSHLHYGIDLAGAWAFAFAVYVAREGWPGPKADAGSSSRLT